MLQGIVAAHKNKKGHELNGVRQLTLTGTLKRFAIKGKENFSDLTHETFVY